MVSERSLQTIELITELEAEVLPGCDVGVVSDKGLLSYDTDLIEENGNEKRGNFQKLSGRSNHLLRSIESGCGFHRTTDLLSRRLACMQDWQS